MKRNFFTGVVVLGIAIVIVFASCSLFGDMDTLREKAGGGKSGDVFDPGDGSAGNPFKVSSAANLQKVGSGTGGWTLAAHYIQTADITLANNSWTPIGTDVNPFTGTYDGNGKTIKMGIQSDPDKCITVTLGNTVKLFGLFSLIRDTGTVKNLKLTGSITGDPGHLSVAGSAVGFN